MSIGLKRQTSWPEKTCPTVMYTVGTMMLCECLTEGSSCALRKIDASMTTEHDVKILQQNLNIRLEEKAALQMEKQPNRCYLSHSKWQK